MTSFFHPSSAQISLWLNATKSHDQTGNQKKESNLDNRIVMDRRARTERVCMRAGPLTDQWELADQEQRERR
jgi:hypothetical protein